MAEERDNLVLIQLREMRAELKSITTKLDQHDLRFDNLDKRFDEMRLYVNHVLGLGTMNDLKARELDARQDESEARQKRMAALMAEIELRLGRVEDKPGD